MTLSSFKNVNLVVKYWSIKSTNILWTPKKIQNHHDKEKQSISKFTWKLDNI